MIIYISNTLEKNDVDNAGKTHGIVIRHIASVGGGGGYRCNYNFLRFTY